MAALARGRGRVRADGQRSNLLRWSEDFDNAAWTKFGGGLGSAPTVTANAGTAPDGTETAERIQFSLGGGTSGSDESSVSQSVAGAADPHNETSSVYVKSFDGGSYTIAIGRSLLNGQQQNLVVTEEWQRVSRATLGNAATTYNCVIGLRGGNGTTDTADVLVWGAQLSPGPKLLHYIKTTDRAR